MATSLMARLVQTLSIDRNEILVFFSRFVCVFLIYMLGRSKKYFKLTLFSIGIIIVISMSNYSYLLQAYGKVSTINMEDASTDTRIELSKPGFEIFKENMLFGVGPGNVKNYMPNVGDSVHNFNFWIEVMTDHGIIIFLILLCFF